MAGDNQQLELDRNPSPKDEAKDFQNPDERLRAATHAHELALIQKKLDLIERRKGQIGRITGSTNDAMNTGTLILILCLGLMLISMIGTAFNPTAFGPITDNLFKVVLAVAGYIFGTKATPNAD